MSADLAASLQLLSAVDKDFLSNETMVSTGAPRVNCKKINIYEKMGPTHNNQNGPGGPKKGGSVKITTAEMLDLCY